MDKISAPTPQISRFIRDDDFFVHSSVYPNWIQRQQPRDHRRLSASLDSAQRQYEKDVYDLARWLGHSMDEAEGWVLQAREFCSEKNYIKDETAKTKLLAKGNSGLRVEIDRMEAADKTKEEKSAKKDAKKARIADLKEQGKPQQQRKKGRKGKSELPIQSKVHPEEHYKHKKRIMDNDIQDDNSKKNKSKKGGPEHSPFFQRSIRSKAKDSCKKAEQQMVFQPLMI